MGPMVANPRMSWPAWKLPVIWTVAPVRVGLSMSTTVRPGSIALAASFSVYVCAVGAVLEAGRDRHRGATEAGAVGIRDRQGGVDGGGGATLGVVQGAAGRHGRGIVDCRDVDGASLRGAGKGAVVDHEGDRPRARV